MNTVDTINVNGINYTISGGGSGTNSGTFNFTAAVISKEVLGYSQACIDMEALVDQLRKSGVDVDAPNFLNENELRVSLTICPLSDANAILNFAFHKDGQDPWALDYYTPDAPIIPKTINFNWNPVDSLKDILLKVENVIAQRPFNLESYKNIFTNWYSNMIFLHYNEINEYQFFNVSDVNEFCKNVFIEYSSGSDSGSI